MEIWIRSQDGARLQKCNNLSVYQMIKNNGGTYNEIYTCLSFNDEEDIVWVDKMGYYSSKGKALKLLDMIKTHIEVSGKQTVQINEDKWIHYDENVFQMPQDDDVEA